MYRDVINERKIGKVGQFFSSYHSSLTFIIYYLKKKTLRILFSSFKNQFILVGKF